MGLSAASLCECIIKKISSILGFLFCEQKIGEKWYFELVISFFKTEKGFTLRRKFSRTRLVSIVRVENPTRCHSVTKFYFIFMWSSTCVGRHTVHHRELKTALAASGFACVEGCWTCSWRTLSGRAWQRPPITRPTTFHACKTRGCQCSFKLPMMGGVSPDTSWASHKYEIKFCYTVASRWIFYMNYAMMHGSMNIKNF